MYFVFLLSYTNSRESLGELEKAVETLACGSCSHSISLSPKLPPCLICFVYLMLNLFCSQHLYLLPWNK